MQGDSALAIQTSDEGNTIQKESIYVDVRIDGYGCLAVTAEDGTQHVSILHRLHNGSSKSVLVVKPCPLVCTNLHHIRENQRALQ